MENIKKNQMEILESKHAITEIKTSMDRLNDRMEGDYEKTQ